MAEAKGDIKRICGARALLNGSLCAAFLCRGRAGGRSPRPPPGPTPAPAPPRPGGPGGAGGPPLPMHSPALPYGHPAPTCLLPLRARFARPLPAALDLGKTSPRPQKSRPNPQPPTGQPAGFVLYSNYNVTGYIAGEKEKPL